MGLRLTAKGFDEEIYDSGYMGFTHFRIAVAKAYNREFGELYEQWINSLILPFGEKMNQSDLDRMNELADEGLNILLKHSDCDGKLTPKECKAIYNVTKDLKCDYPQNNYTSLRNI